MRVDHGDDYHVGSVDAVHDTVRKSPQQKATRVVFVTRPRRRCALDVPDGGIHLLSKTDSSHRAPLSIPARSLFRFLESLVEEFKRADHGLQPPESGDGLPTMEPSSRDQNRAGQAVVESLRTKPLRRPRQSLRRGSE